MILLEANSEFLEINTRDLSFNITVRSPFFGYLSSFVYNFTIPYTPRNARIFKFPDRLNRLSKTQATCPGRILIDGLEVASGTWQAQAHGEQFIEVAFIFVADNFITALDQVQIPDLFDEEITVADIIAHVEDTAENKVYPETEYQFPSVHAPEFYGGKNENFKGIINNFESGEFYSNSIIFNTNTIVPMLYLFAVLNRIWEASGYSAKGKIFEDAMLQKCLLFNNYALDNLHDVRFLGEAENLMVTEADFFVIDWDEVEDNTNRYANGLYEIAIEGNYEVIVNMNFTTADKTKVYTYIIQLEHQPLAGGNTVTIGDPHTGTTDFDPIPSVSFVEQANDLGIGTLFVTIKLYEWANSGAGYYDVEILTGSVIIRKMDELGINIFPNTFNLKNHAPKFAAIDFVKMFFEEYQLFPVFDNVSKNIQLLSLNDVISSAQQFNLSEGLIRESIRVEQNTYNGLRLAFDFGDDDDQYFTPDRIDYEVDSFADLDDMLIKEHEVYFVKSLQAYYQLITVKKNETLNTSWAVVSHKSLPYIDGNGADERTLKFAPCMMRNVETLLDDLPRSMPTVLGQGTSKAYEMVNDWPLRVMFYAGYGVGATGTTDTYPFATTTMYDTQGNAVFDYNYNADAILANFWKATLDFLKTRLKIEFDRTLTPYELKVLDLARRQFFQDAHMIIEELYIEVNKELSSGKVRGWVL
jgi:hypothetical protein